HAAAVAITAAGKPVTTRPIGALGAGAQLANPAVGKLEPDDVIVAANGTRIRTPADLFSAMSHVRVGDTVRFTVRRGDQTLVERIKTVKSDQPPNRAVVAVFVEPATDVHLPFPVRINAGAVGGPPARAPFSSHGRPGRRPYVLPGRA